MPTQEVRDQMVKVFQRWGKPKALRVDNGEPFGSPEPSTTSALALWMMAHGIKVIHNKPRCPKQNAQVEKMQDTSSRWAEVSRCKTLPQVRARLQAAASVQREQYPVQRLENQTRAARYPEIATLYRIWQHQDYQPSLAYQFLAGKIYTRKASSQGQITHMAHRINLGTTHKHLAVTLQLDADTLQWNIFHPNGQQIKTEPALYLQADRILNLSVYSKN